MDVLGKITGVGWHDWIWADKPWATKGVPSEHPHLCLVPRRSLSPAHGDDDIETFTNGKMIHDGV